MLVRQTTDLKENLKRKYIFILGHQKERQDEMTNIQIPGAGLGFCIN